MNNLHILILHYPKICLNERNMFSFLRFVTEVFKIFITSDTTEFLSRTLALLLCWYCRSQADGVVLKLLVNSVAASGNGRAEAGRNISSSLISFQETGTYCQYCNIR